MGEQRSRKGAAAAVPVAKVSVLGGAPKHSALMPAPAVMGESAWAALVVRTAIEGEGGAWSSALAARSLPASMGECPHREGKKAAVHCSGFSGDKRTDPELKRQYKYKAPFFSSHYTHTGPNRWGAFCNHHGASVTRPLLLAPPSTVLPPPLRQQPAPPHTTTLQTMLVILNYTK